MKMIHKDGSGALYAYQDKDETLDYTVDWTRWLGGDTISSVTHTASGVALTSSSNTTTAYTIWVRGSGGYVTSTIVTAGGRTKQETVKFRETVA